jgi:hypothetical protein
MRWRVDSTAHFRNWNMDGQDAQDLKSNEFIQCIDVWFYCANP